MSVEIARFGVTPRTVGRWRERFVRHRFKEKEKGKDHGGIRWLIAGQPAARMARTRVTSEGEALWIRIPVPVVDVF
jgi:hypothetical protein